VAALRYLALGDSYTIGTGAREAGSDFPSRLARRLEEASGASVEVFNPAVDGYSSRDLIERELPQVRQAPHLCSILIGANDVVQRVPEDEYRRNLGAIYDFVLRFRLPPGRVAALSIPDFSAAPGASPFGSQEGLLASIQALNSVARQEATRRAFSFVDLTEISRSGAGRPGWLADDALHPSDAQYAAWAGWIWDRLRPIWLAAS
jgi:lysophospholipase L1-like esterase